MDLSIIIVSWNVHDLLKKCLESIYEQTRGITFEIFVIDNASDDNSAHMVASLFPNVRLIQNKKNKGFASANNQGLKQAQGDLVALLNPDTQLIENSFKTMIEFMKEKEKAGVAGCRILNPDNTPQESVRKFPTFMNQSFILLKLHHLFPRFKPFFSYRCANFDYSREQKVDQVMGAFFIISRKMFRHIGILDQGFFNWFEEVDYCKRIYENHYEVWYTPKTKIIHHFGQSFRKVMQVKKQRMWNKSLRYYFIKHHSGLSFFAISLLTWISLLLSFIIQTYQLKKRA